MIISFLLQEVDLPPPPDEPGELHEDGCRLWIGNLDSRVTESVRAKHVYYHINRGRYLHVAKIKL